MTLKNSVNREINILMPYGNINNVLAQYVQVTKDGKYILNYLEKRNNIITPNFTEIVNIDGTWAKSPFHLGYEDYSFEEFDSELSDRIINELPKNMKIKIVINDDKKVVNSLEENTNKVEINSLGATEITEELEQDVYCVLISNATEDIITKEEYYPYEFPFPIFSIEGKTNHRYADLLNDTNNDIDFNELEFSRYGLSQDLRKDIKNFLLEQGNAYRINDLPILMLNNGDEKLKVHFINCPEITIFNDVYKSKIITIDCDLEEDISIEELFSKAFNNEIPYYFETEVGTKKDNGVRHKSIVK